MTAEPVVARAPALVVRSAPLADPGDLTALLPPRAQAGDLLSWVRDGDGLVGWGRAAGVDTHGPHRFAEADAWWREVVSRSVVRDAVGLPGSGPVAFGSFAFADDSPAGASLIVPSVIVGRYQGQAWVTTVRRGHDLPSTVSPRRQPAPTPPRVVGERAGALDPHAWADAVAAGVARVRSGAVDKVVLARDVLATCAEPIDERALLSRLAQAYPNTWVFCVDDLVGATPELLLRRERGLVTSRVLAGTIRRTGDDDRDLALAAGLARSSKDLEEHEYAVRSVVDALRPHCQSTNVPEAPFVLHLPNVMHLATDVAGVLRDDASSLVLAAALHPSAAVCGTPTDAAATLITELEQMDRGRYAGPVGWMDADGDGEWGIALRCGQLVDESTSATTEPTEATEFSVPPPRDARTLRMFAGCGIVAGSDPRSELAESEAKLVPMRTALGDPG